MAIQEVSCFALVTNPDDDDDDGFVTETLDHLYSGSRRCSDQHSLSPSIHWLGQGLQLQVKPLQGEGGADLIGWLGNRSQSPLANYHIARCPTRARCLKCEAAKKVTCEALNQAPCLSCREGLPLYCIGLGSPLLCPKWGPLEVREYKARQDFFRQRERRSPSGMSTRTVRLADRVKSPETLASPSHPVSRLRKGFSRLVGREAKAVGRDNCVSVNSTLAEDLGGLGLALAPRAVSGPSPGVVQPASFEEEMAAREESRRGQFRGRYLGTGVQGSRGDQWREQLPRTVGQDSLMTPASEGSNWEEGYTADLGGGRCPIDRNHCASTPNDPNDQCERFDTQCGKTNLSSVSYLKDV